MDQSLFSQMLFCVLILVAQHSASAAAIDIVPVGNAGNESDPADGDSRTLGVQNYGSVAYNYCIGTTEVTNAQYAAFLNAKAKSDPLGLYNMNMGSDAHGGITRSGATGGFTYATKPNMDDKPVNLVSWYDAIRFANWLHNGQGNGDTETGAYTLEGGTSTPSNGPSIIRNVGATWFLPSEDEWYKAAYYQPAEQGGDSDNYWLYPTRSNVNPKTASADATGNTSNPGINVANYNIGANWNGQIGNLTTVGSAGPLSKSFYGTADQGGNLFELNESLVIDSFRGLRGGSWANQQTALQASFRAYNFPLPEGSDDVGFRVASIAGPQFPGDVNFDRVVDFTDLNILLTNYGLPSKFATGDFDYSGTVDFNDLNTLLSNYGLQAPASSAISPVPEPSTFTLAALGLLIAACRKLSAPTP